MLNNGVMVRQVIDKDLLIFFVQQQNPDANQMAAFTSREPSDQQAFNSHWQKIMTRVGEMRILCY